MILQVGDMDFLFPGQYPVTNLSLIFQFPIYLEPGVLSYLIYWLAWELGSKYKGNWKMRVYQSIDKFVLNIWGPNVHRFWMSSHEMLPTWIFPQRTLRNCTSPENFPNLCWFFRVLGRRWPSSLWKMATPSLGDDSSSSVFAGGQYVEHFHDWNQFVLRDITGRFHTNLN